MIISIVTVTERSESDDDRPGVGKQSHPSEISPTQPRGHGVDNQRMARGSEDTAGDARTGVVAMTRGKGYEANPGKADTVFAPPAPPNSEVME